MPSIHNHQGSVKVASNNIPNLAEMFDLTMLANILKSHQDKIENLEAEVKTLKRKLEEKE